MISTEGLQAELQERADLITDVCEEPIFEVSVEMGDPVLVLPEEADEVQLRDDKFTMGLKLRTFQKLAPGIRLMKVSEMLLEEKWEPFLALCGETYGGVDFGLESTWSDVDKENMIQLVGMAMQGVLSGVTVTAIFSPATYFNRLIDQLFTPSVLNCKGRTGELLRRAWSEASLFLCQDLMLSCEENETRECFVIRCHGTAHLIAQALQGFSYAWGDVGEQTQAELDKIGKRV
jgi:hypothetical protein